MLKKKKKKRKRNIENVIFFVQIFHNQETVIPKLFHAFIESSN